MFKKSTIVDIVEDKSFNPTKKRPLVSILVIDDKKFAYLDMLKKNDFKVRQVKDLEDFSVLKGYEIVLCDVDGVGLKLGFKDGAELMVEVKKRFPLKPLVAYSSHDYKINKIVSSVDLTMDKDQPLPAWINNLESLITILYNPKKQWIQARNILLENDVDIYSIAKLESEFVKSIIRDEISQFSSNQAVNALGENLKPVISSLVANLVFELAKKAV